MLAEILDAVFIDYRAIRDVGKVDVHFHDMTDFAAGGAKAGIEIIQCNLKLAANIVGNVPVTRDPDGAGHPYIWTRPDDVAVMTERRRAPRHHQSFNCFAHLRYAPAPIFLRRASYDDNQPSAAVQKSASFSQQQVRNADI